MFLTSDIILTLRLFSMKFVYLKYIKNEMLNIKPMLTISFFFDFVSLK